MAKATVSPEHQIRNLSRALEQTEYNLEQQGIDVRLLRQWLHQTLHYRAVVEQHERGELSPIEYAEDTDDD